MRFLKKRKAVFNKRKILFSFLLYHYPQPQFLNRTCYFVLLFASYLRACVVGKFQFKTFLKSILS